MRSLRPSSYHPDRLLLSAMVILTFVTGMVDAAGYLGLDKVFVGNMTGNVVILGMGLVGTDGLPVLGPAVAFVAFTAAAYLTRVFLRAERTPWCTRQTICLVVNAAILVGCALTALIAHGTLMQGFVAGASAFAMGTQATVARRANVKDMTTVVVTSTLVMLASESTSLDRRFVAIGAMALGAVVGAVLLIHVHLAVVFGAAGLLASAAAALSHHQYRRR